MTLTTILLTLLTFAMGSFGFCFYRNARFTANDLSSQILDQTSKLIDVQINDLLHTASEQGRTNLSLLQSGRFHQGDFPDLAHYWLDIMKVHPRHTRLSIALEENGEWYYVHRTAGKLAVGRASARRGNRQAGNLRVLGERRYPRTSFFTNPDKSDVDPLGAGPGISRPKQSQKQIWSETYVFFGSRGDEDVPGITCATPILTEEGAFLGVLAASFDVIELSTYLSGLAVGQNGYAFVVECRKDSSKVGDRPQGPEDPSPKSQSGRDRAPARRPRKLVEEPGAGADRGVARQASNRLARARSPPASTRRSWWETSKLIFEHDGVRYLGAYSCLSTRETPRLADLHHRARKGFSGPGVSGQPDDVRDRGRRS